VRTAGRREDGRKQKALVLVSDAFEPLRTESSAALSITNALESEPSSLIKIMQGSKAQREWFDLPLDLRPGIQHLLSKAK
jgi:hypothetical protein